MWDTGASYCKSIMSIDLFDHRFTPIDLAGDNLIAGSNSFLSAIKTELLNSGIMVFDLAYLYDEFNSLYARVVNPSTKRAVIIKASVIELKQESWSHKAIRVAVKLLCDTTPSSTM